MARRWLLYGSNVPAGAAVLLLLLDPARPLGPVFLLLGVSLGLILGGIFLQSR
jgi:hypothetical protein